MRVPDTGRHERDGRAAVIFASAPSQNEFLSALRADPAVPWPKLTAFHLEDFGPDSLQYMTLTQNGQKLWQDGYSDFLAGGS